MFSRGRGMSTMWPRCRLGDGGAAIDRASIAERIREFLDSEFAGQGGELTETTHLLDDFFVDSFGIIETVMFLESKFGIEITRADINGENFQDIASLSRFVSTRQSD
jgi:acyl carrier protein